MIWVLLLLGAVGVGWFLLAPRRLQTLDNTQAVVDERLKAHDIIDTTEDPREVDAIAMAENQRLADGEMRGFQTLEVPQGEEERSERGPLNHQ